MVGHTRRLPANPRQAPGRAHCERWGGQVTEPGARCRREQASITDAGRDAHRFDKALRSWLLAFLPTIEPS